MTKSENADSLLSRLDRLKRMISGYKDNLQPEDYKILIEDIVTVEYNIKELKQYIDDSILHRTHTLKELFEFARKMGS